MAARHGALHVGPHDSNAERPAARKQVGSVDSVQCGVPGGAAMAASRCTSMLTKKKGKRGEGRRGGQHHSYENINSTHTSVSGTGRIKYIHDVISLISMREVIAWPKMQKI